MQYIFLDIYTYKENEKKTYKKRTYLDLERHCFYIIYNKQLEHTTYFQKI